MIECLRMDEHAVLAGRTRTMTLFIGQELRFG